MIGFLRFVGLMNAAVWFGAAVFFTLGAGPAVFSQDMRLLLGERFFPYFSGAIAQVIIARYFQLQLICAAVAALHAAAEWLYLGRPLRRFGLGLLAGLLCFSFAGACVMQPKIKELHTKKYTLNAAPEIRQAATRSLRVWHGTAQAINLLMLAGLVVYLWRVANPSDTTRFVASAKFQG